MCSIVSRTCDLYSNIGCATGSKCSVTDTPGQTVCECAGTATHGQACRQTSTGDTCAPGNVCLGDNLCHKYCRDSGECVNATSTGGVCDLQIGNLNVKVCSSATTNCSPILPATAGCAMGSGCYFVGPTDDRTACISAGTKLAGETCSFGNDCAPGYICMSNNLCRQMCRAGRDGDCAGAQRCFTLQGSTLYGVCLPP